MNEFKYSLDNKRYHTLNYFYRSKFNSKVFKVPLDAGFSCPNKVNGNGCIFCSYGSGNRLSNLSLLEQFENVKKTMLKKWPNSKYIAYFQANTNTYAPLDVLKEKYESVLGLDGVIGIAIATRCDALSIETLDYLEELSKRTFLTVEVGLQSMHEKTLKFINRGHNLDSFIWAIKELKKRNIFTVVHIINGLPGESKEMMVETAKFLNGLGIDGIKIHMLYISKGTKLEEIYRNEPFHILSKDEYIDIVCTQLEYFKDTIVIERITGDPIKEELIEPRWLLKKFQVLNDIDKEMKKRNIWQGDEV